MEAGIVLLEDGVVVEEYATLVNPGVRIPYAIQQFTGITEAMVADAPPFEAVADAIASRIEGRLFVAHNARFDYGFLRSEFRRLGRRFRAPVLCTVRLSRALTPDERGHNLDAVMRRHGIACDARHRALGDAKVLAEFLRIARARWPAAKLATHRQAAHGHLAPAAAARPRARRRVAGRRRASTFSMARTTRSSTSASRRTSRPACRPTSRNRSAKLEKRTHAARAAHRVDRDGRRVRRARDRGAAHQGEEARVQPQAPRRLARCGPLRCARTARCRSRRSACSMRSTIPGASYGMFRRARAMPSARSKGSRANTSSARNGSGSSRPRAPASASSSAAAAASASARSRLRCTRCARGLRCRASSAAIGRFPARSASASATGAASRKRTSSIAGATPTSRSTPTSTAS